MSIKELNPDGCRALCAAVVEQAVKDYDKALRILKKNPDNVKAKALAGECELFFRKYADNWTDIDGESIIKAIKERVKNDKHSEKKGRQNAG